MSTPIIRSVLAATDLSATSDEVLRTAAALAARAGAELHVLHVYDFPVTLYGEGTLDVPSFQDHVRDAERALEEQVRRMVPEGQAVAGRQVLIDLPARGIVETAKGVSADLIVLGPHRKGGLEQRLLGSTADRVVRTAEVPCLIVRCYLNLPLRRIVVPMDLSEPAREALDVALAWGRRMGPSDPEIGLPAVDLRVIHVLPPVLMPSQALPSGHAVVGPELHREVAAALERGGGASDVLVGEELLWGDSAAEEIVRYAEQEQAGLLVMATHGHGAVSRALLGSVASAVARDARCCVLLVPPAMWSTKRGAQSRVEAHKLFNV